MEGGREGPKEDLAAAAFIFQLIFLLSAVPLSLSHMHTCSYAQDIRPVLGGRSNEIERPGMGSNRVTVTKFLQLLKILELYLELSYFLSQVFIAVTVTEVTKAPKFPIRK